MKPLSFIGSAQKDIQDFPEDVKDDVGYALFQIQQGEMPASAKPLKGFGAGVLEIVENFRGDAYRAVCVARFEGAVYVLHCFRKKSKYQAATPARDLDVMRRRLMIAETDHAKNYRGEK